MYLGDSVYYLAVSFGKPYRVTLRDDNTYSVRVENQQDHLIATLKGHIVSLISYNEHVTRKFLYDMKIPAFSCNMICNHEGFMKILYLNTFTVKSTSFNPRSAMPVVWTQYERTIRRISSIEELYGGPLPDVVYAPVELHTSLMYLGVGVARDINKLITSSRFQMFYEGALHTFKKTIYWHMCEMRRFYGV